jgi:hypothetical protein
MVTRREQGIPIVKHETEQKEPYSFDSTRYGKKLAIVVPYRDRADHLRQFIPHMMRYFSRDKLDRSISFSINIIEQVSPERFNRGKLKNVGFDLVRRQSDYVCFHDVDYLPIWADYSWSVTPARLIWYGLTLREDYESFFGGVVLFDNNAFAKVNGYPNCYWGWGPEDLELGLRCRFSDFQIDKRDGTYQSLPHQHAGFEKPGVLTPEAKKSAAMFASRRDRLRELSLSDGLSNLRYSLVGGDNIKVGDKVMKNLFHYKVRIEE